MNPDAIKSAWVDKECQWAFELTKSDMSRKIIPVLAEVLGESNEYIRLFIKQLKWVCDARRLPFPAIEAAHWTLIKLGLKIHQPAQINLPNPTKIVVTGSWCDRSTFSYDRSEESIWRIDIKQEGA